MPPPVFGSELSNNGIFKKPWFEARSQHFRVFSCGETQEVAKITAQLEQFRAAYGALAGGQAVESPPILVLAFPDHETMSPFLPLYNGQPANMAAFFHRDHDENFIALYLSAGGTESLQPVFHEYAHLLFRHNLLFWPMWMNEGMADIYSTFDPAPDGTVLIGKPIDYYLKILERETLLPSKQLFAVTSKSADYNERERQGIFYAESWLLVDYLMLGDNAFMRSRFGTLTSLLKKGHTAEQAFTNAFGVTTVQMDNQLRGYLKRGKFEPLRLSVRTSVGSPQNVAFRHVGSVEAYCRIGDMLMRIGRLQDAEECFNKAKSIAPLSPLPVEALGLLADERKQANESVALLGKAIQQGYASYLAHYVWAREKYRLTAAKGDSYSRVPDEVDAPLHAEVLKSIQLMPDFAPAHELLGFMMMVQGEKLPEAERHLQRAIQLEPDNEGYLFTLAQLQIHMHDIEGARRTLEPLRLASSDPELKKHAEDLLKRIEAK